jgi:hypothetical protein
LVVFTDAAVAADVPILTANADALRRAALSL